MKAARALLAWRGEAYGGWQLQPNVPTVQGVVEAAVSQIMARRRVVVRAAGRLDAGVHAIAQVVAFEVPEPRSPRVVHRGLNGLLPDDVACVALSPTTRAFDPRRFNRGKIYRYRLLNKWRKCPFRAGSCWRVGQELDVDAMREAATALVGKHDFSSFRAAGCAAMHPVRGVRSIRFEETHDEVVVVIEGEAFLRHQVRIMTGCLVEVGLGRRPPSWLEGVVAARDRAAAARTAPPHGLWLERVLFEPELSWEVGEDPWTTP